MLLENIYRSEAGSDTLVFYDSTEFPEDQKTSVGFLTNTPYGIPNRRLVNKLVNQMTRLCSNVRDLVDLHVKFHPIREFMHHKMKYQVH